MSPDPSAVSGDPSPAVAAEVGAPLRRPGAWPPGFGSTPRDRDALLVLSHLARTPGRLHALAWEEGSAAGCLRAVVAGSAGTPSDRRLAQMVEPDDVRSAVLDAGAREVSPADDEYPEALLDLPDPPACLFVRGGVLPGTSARPTAAVAVVGARSSSAYGREVAGDVAAGLAAGGVCVVSGAARGIDAAAHVGALRAGGPTVAVLGSGIDVDYPRAHADLISEVASSGAVVSEYPPGAPALPWRFPARNRIVAALSRAVVVVEGAPKSGSLITVDFATDLGREVMAVPGQVTNPLSAVPHALIREGAALIRDAADVLAALGMEPSDEVAAAPAGPADGAAVSGDEGRILEALSGGPVTVDAAARAAGLDAASTVAVLVALELRGMVRSVGGRYERSRPPVEHSLRKPPVQA